MTENSTTIFDKILEGTIPCTKVYEDQHVLAFKDINPVASIHVLVIPKKKFQSFTDLKSAQVDILGFYLQKISHVANLLGLEKDGYRVIFNHGSDGQQTVDYLHAHILGGRKMKWPPG